MSDTESADRERCPECETLSERDRSVAGIAYRCPDDDCLIVVWDESSGGQVRSLRTGRNLTEVDEVGDSP